jgi:DNA-binding NarL/FixJ family response regulator
MMIAVAVRAGWRETRTGTKVMMDVQAQAGPEGRRATKAGKSFLVVDDHPLVRHGFALSVGEIHPDATVLEAGSLEEALKLARSTPGLLLVLFDLNLGDRSGHEGVRRMIEALGDVPLLVISGSDDVTDIIDSIRMGARGYILKAGSMAVLEHAISLVLTGETFLPLPRTVLTGGLATEPARSRGQIVDRLTGRQRDVFHLLLAGHSNKEIARELGVLEGTVKVHVRAIMQKLGVRNRTQVAVVAARSGCFPEESQGE